MNKTIKIKLSELNKFKPREGINKICFDLSEAELNESSGKKILSFLTDLKNKKIDFKITRPLPRCLFYVNYYHAIRDFNVPRNCRECPELFFEDKKEMIVFCDILKNIVGPKKEYLRDKEQIYDYFKTFYDVLKSPKKCKSCIYNIRGKCNTCFNKK